MGQPTVRELLDENDFEGAAALLKFCQERIIKGTLDKHEDYMAVKSSEDINAAAEIPKRIPVMHQLVAQVDGGSIKNMRRERGISIEDLASSVADQAEPEEYSEFNQKVWQKTVEGQVRFLEDKGVLNMAYYKARRVAKALGVPIRSIVVKEEKAAA